MTVETVVGFVSSLLAIIFLYAPGLKDKYLALATNYQRLIMLGLLVLVVGGAYGLSCYGWFDYFTCDNEGLIKAGKLLLAAIAANQTTYMILPKPNTRSWKA